jgi:hypothetical protein
LNYLIQACHRDQKGRKMYKSGAAILLLLALLGCDVGGKSEEMKGVTVSLGGETQARLETMPEGQRNAVFIRAIRDAGLTCQYVESSAFAGRYKDAPMWAAHCRNEDWAILLGAEGAAQILTCRDAQIAGLPTCPASQKTDTSLPEAG